MTAQRTAGGSLSRTTVLIRSDILERARESRIDISRVCNDALAGMLGIDYRQQQIPAETPVHPVIIAKEPPAKTPERESREHGVLLRPVLNADDPATPARLLKMKKEPSLKARPAAHPPKTDGGREGSPEPSAVPADIAPPRGAPEKVAKGASSRKGNNDTIRQFLSRKILRTDPGAGDENRITKDEMYQLFLRFCRTKPGGPAIDKRRFSIALKNRFVLEDSTAGEIPYWNNVKLR